MQRVLLLFLLMLSLFACSGCAATKACTLFLLDAWTDDDYEQRKEAQRKEAERQYFYQRIEEEAMAN